MTKEQTIVDFMEHLQISRAEAEQLYEDDKDDFIGEEGEKFQAKAETIHRKTERKSPKSKKKRVPKQDPEKLKIVSILAECLAESGYNPEIKNPQRQIDFGEYSLTLIKHRPPKK